MKEKKSQKGKGRRRHAIFLGGEREWEEREREKKFLYFPSLEVLRKSNRRFLSEQKAKSVHASRATRGY